MSSSRVKLAALSLLGFASGLPYLLVGSTLSAWLTQVGADLPRVGLLSLVTVPYSIKVVWAPLLDRYSPGGFLGRRRGWMVPAQLGVAATLWALGGVDPTRVSWQLPLLALACAFFSATNDVLTDAYQTELLEPAERGPGASATVLGYRAAMMVAGGLALGLSERVPFGVLYRALAVVAALLALLPIFVPEPPPTARPASLAASIVEPLRELWSRPTAPAALAFLLFYRLGDTLVQTLATPFLLSLGFSAGEVGAVNQALGIGATIAGSVAGGWAVARLGLHRALFVFCILPSLTNLGYAWLAWTGRSHAGLVAVVLVDNLCGGLAVAASVALVMSLCDRRFSATQFALLTSVAGLGGRLLGGGSGLLAARIGWAPFFIVTMLPAIPALLLLGRLKASLQPVAADSSAPRSSAT